MKTITKPITIITSLALVFTLIMPVTAEAKQTPKLNKTKITLTITTKKARPTYKLKVKNTTKKAKWKTSNKKVATVSSTGKVTAKKKGNAVITVRASGQTLRCRVIVKDNRKNKTNTSTKTPASTTTPSTETPASTPTPVPTPTPKCEHVYDDHWATFEEYYDESTLTDTPWRVCCHCGLMINENRFTNHLSWYGMYLNLVENDPYDPVMGLHGTASKSSVETVIINGKSYLHIKTEYIDKRTCTKCGRVEEKAFDMPDGVLKRTFSDGYATPVDPYAASDSSATE